MDDNGESPPIVIDDETDGDSPVDRWHWDAQSSRLPSSAQMDKGGPSPSSASAGTRSRKRVLYLFSGPAGRKDGLAAYLEVVGIRVDECDVLNTHMVDQDLLDDSTWLRIKGRVRSGYYLLVFASPPCRSFSASRSSGPGPPVLRDAEHIYGFPKSQTWRKLGHHHFERIREDNLFAERTAEACADMDSLGRPYAVEQPEPWGAAVTMFGFDSFKELLAGGALIVKFDQCPYGAPCKKPTAVLYKGGDFHSLQAKCGHPAVEQQANDGSIYWAAHPSFVGKKDNAGVYLTSSLSAYPAKLNCAAAAIINKAITPLEDTS